jgi:hypothetical protein
MDHAGMVNNQRKRAASSCPGVVAHAEFDTVGQAPDDAAAKAPLACAGCGGQKTEIRVTAPSKIGG